MNSNFNQQFNQGSSDPFSSQSFGGGQGFGSFDCQPAGFGPSHLNNGHSNFNNGQDFNNFNCSNDFNRGKDYNRGNDFNSCNNFSSNDFNSNNNFNNTNSFNSCKNLSNNLNNFNNNFDNPQSSHSSYPSPSLNSFPSPGSPFGEPSTPSSRSAFGQLDTCPSFGGQQPAMGENNSFNMFNQSSSSLTPTTSPFQVPDFGEPASSYEEAEQDEQDQLDLVQNYGVRDSEVYREKRDRNNAAVRKARKKFQKKNQEVIHRLEVLREENRRLLHQKEIVQTVHDEFRDLSDMIAANRRAY